MSDFQKCQKCKKIIPVSFSICPYCKYVIDKKNTEFYSNVSDGSKEIFNKKEGKNG